MTTRISPRIHRARAMAAKLEKSQMRICHEAALVILDLADVLTNRAPKLYGQANPNCKWSEGTVMSALRMLKNGESTREVSRVLGVPQATIHYWKKKRVK